MFVVNKDPEVDATTDAGVALLRAFSYINKQHSPTKALSFITDVSMEYYFLLMLVRPCPL